MNRNKFRLNLDFLIICLIGLHVFFWFEKDLLYIGGDSGIPLNPIKNLQHLFTWQVQQGGTESWNLTTCFHYLFFALFEFLGCSLPVIQRLYIYFIYTSAGLSMYYLAVTFAEDRKRMVGLIAGLFYMFNPFALGMTQVSAYLPYPVMPLILALFCRGLTNRMGKIKSILFIFLALFGIIGDLPNYKNYGVAVLLMLLCSMYYLIIGEVKVRHVVKYLGALGLLLILLSLWFILPFGSFLSYTTIGEKLVQHGIDFGDYGYATIANLFRLLGSAAFHAGGATYGKYYMDNPLLVLIGYGVPILAFLSIILKPRSKSVLLFSIISLVFIFIAKGTNPPLGEVYKWVVLHVPLARAFRTSWSLSLGASIGYAFLIGTTAASLFDRIRVSRPYLARFTIGTIVLIILVHSWPLVQGTYLEVIHNPPDYKGVRIPDAYYEMERFISSDPDDFRILKIPVTGGYITTNWGYSGSNIMLYILSMPFIDSYILPTSSSQICKLLFDLIEKEDFTNLDKFLNMLNIKYILVDGYDKTSIYNRNLMRYVNRFSSQPNLKLVKRIDRMYLFKNTSRLSHIYPAANPVIVKGSIDSLFSLVTDGFSNDNPGFLFMEQGKGSENYPVDKTKEIIFCNQQMIDLVCDLIEPKYYCPIRRSSFSVEEGNMYSIWLNTTGTGQKKDIENILIDGEKITDKLTTSINSQRDIYLSSGEKWQYLGDAFLSGGEHKLALIGKKEYGIDGELLVIPKDEFRVQADKIEAGLNNPGINATYLFSKDDFSAASDKEAVVNSPVYFSGTSVSKVICKISPQTVNKENYFYKGNLGIETELKEWSFNKGTKGIEPVIASIDKGRLILLNLNKNEIKINLDARAGSGGGGSGDIKAWLNGSLIDKDKISAYLPEVLFKELPLLTGKNIVTIGDIPISNDFQIDIVSGVIPHERLSEYDNRYSYSNSEEKGLVINTDYNSGPGREELITLVRKISAMNLSEFPFISLTASVDEPGIQGIEIIGGIDYSGDGVIDGFINVPLEPPLVRHGAFKLDLYEAAQQRFPYKNSYSLCELGIIGHKRWGRDCSGKSSGNYRFYFKEVSLYSDKTVMLCGWDSNSETIIPEIESKNIDFNRLLLDDGRLVINTYFAGNRLSRGKVSEGEEGKEKRVFVLQSGDRLTGDIVEEDTSIIRLKGVKELDNTPVEIWKDKVSYEYKINGEMGLMGKIISQDIDNSSLSSNRYLKTTYLSGKVDIDEYPYLSVIYKVDDQSAQRLECELGLDGTNDGIEDMAVPLRKNLTLKNWWWLGSSSAMDFYTVRLPDEFSRENTTYNLSGNGYTVYRNGEPVKNRLKDWEDGKVMVDIGVLRPGEIILNLPKGESPDKDEWTINYLPGPLASNQFPGYMEFNVNINEILEDKLSPHLNPTHLVRLSLYLKHRLSTQSGVRNSYNFEIKDVTVYKKSTTMLPDILRDKEVIDNLPLFKIDDKKFLFQDTHLSSDDDRKDVRRGDNSLWIETDAIELDKGNHTISPLFNNTFTIHEMVVEPYNKISASGEVKLPTLNVQKINPTKYVVKSDITSPFLLVFNESFNKLWSAYCKALPVDKKGALQNRRIEITRHYIVNGYANGWWVDADELKSLNPDAKSFEIILEYKPQRLFRIGLTISLATLLLCIAYLVGRAIGRTGVPPVKFRR